MYWMREEIDTGKWLYNNDRMWFGQNIRREQEGQYYSKRIWPWRQSSYHWGCSPLAELKLGSYFLIWISKTIIKQSKCFNTTIFFPHLPMSVLSSLCLRKLSEVTFVFSYLVLVKPCFSLVEYKNSDWQVSVRSKHCVSAFLLLFSKFMYIQSKHSNGDYAGTSALLWTQKRHWKRRLKPCLHMIKPSFRALNHTKLFPTCLLKN